MPMAELALYDALIAFIDGLKRKGKKIPYTSINGHMFSFLADDGTLCLRLSAADRDAFMQSVNADPVMQYGKIMKEYVALPAELLDDTDVAAVYFAQSFDYVLSLKPKPTKRTR